MGVRPRHLVKNVQRRSTNTGYRMSAKQRLQIVAETEERLSEIRQTAIQRALDLQILLKGRAEDFFGPDKLLTNMVPEITTRESQRLLYEEGLLTDLRKLMPEYARIKEGVSATSTIAGVFDREDVAETPLGSTTQSDADAWKRKLAMARSQLQSAHSVSTDMVDDLCRRVYEQRARIRHEISALSPIPLTPLSPHILPIANTDTAGHLKGSSSLFASSIAPPRDKENDEYGLDLGFNIDELAPVTSRVSSLPIGTTKARSRPRTSQSTVTPASHRARSKTPSGRNSVADVSGKPPLEKKTQPRRPHSSAAVLHSQITPHSQHSRTSSSSLSSATSRSHTSTAAVSHPHTVSSGRNSPPKSARRVVVSAVAKVSTPRRASTSATTTTVTPRSAMSSSHRSRDHSTLSAQRHVHLYETPSSEAVGEHYEEEYEEEDIFSPEEKNAAAARIQRAWRNTLVQWRAIRIRLTRFNMAAYVIQTWFKRRIPLRRVHVLWRRTLRETLRRDVEADAAWKVQVMASQAHWNVIKSFASSDPTPENIRREKLWGGGVMVQKLWRGLILRRAYAHLWHSVVRLQALWRGHFIRTKIMYWIRRFAELHRNRQRRKRAALVRQELLAVSDKTRERHRRFVFISSEITHVNREMEREKEQMHVQCTNWVKSMTRSVLSKPMDDEWIPQLDPYTSQTQYLHVGKNIVQLEHPNLIYVEANKRRERPKMEAELTQRLAVLSRYKERLVNALNAPDASLPSTAS